MYKSFLKNTIILLSIALFIVNCDGRTTTAKALKKSVSKFKNEQTIEFESYYPETFTESKKDTLLSNGFKINLSTFTNMQNAFTKTMFSKGAYYKINYREIESKIVIEYNGSIIFNETINKTFLNPWLPEDLANDIHLKGVWVNHETSLLLNVTAIDLEYCKIDSNVCVSYTIHINKNGHFELLPVNAYML